MQFTQSQRTFGHLLNFRFNSSIMEFRKANLDAFVKKYGIKLGFMSVFSKAAAYALQDQPVVNAVIDGNVNSRSFICRFVDTIK